MNQQTANGRLRATRAAAARPPATRRRGLLHVGLPRASLRAQAGQPVAEQPVQAAVGHGAPRRQPAAAVAAPGPKAVSLPFLAYLLLLGSYRLAQLGWAEGFPPWVVVVAVVNRRPGNFQKVNRHSRATASMQLHGAVR